MQPIFSSASSNASANWADAGANRSQAAQWVFNALLSIATQFDRAARRFDARADLARLNVRMLDDIGLTVADRDRLA